MTFKVRTDIAGVFHREEGWRKAHGHGLSQAQQTTCEE